MKVTKLDHLVLTVKDIHETCDFYTTALGMEVVTFEEERKALRFGNQKINLHQAGKELEPKAFKPEPGSADLCLITDTPIDEVVPHFNQIGVKILEGPIYRTGAEGKINSVYVRDPDLNLIEISNYVD